MTNPDPHTWTPKIQAEWNAVMAAKEGRHMKALFFLTLIALPLLRREPGVVIVEHVWPCGAYANVERDYACPKDTSSFRLGIWARGMR